MLPERQGYVPYSRFNRKAIERAKLRCQTAYARLDLLSPGTSEHDACQRNIIKLEARVELLQEIHDAYRKARGDA